MVQPTTKQNPRVTCTLRCCGTHVFLREITGASNALVVDVDLQLLDHVWQPVGHGPQQGVHVGHVCTSTATQQHFSRWVFCKHYSGAAHSTATIRATCSLEATDLKVPACNVPWMHLESRDTCDWLLWGRGRE